MQVYYMIDRCDTMMSVGKKAFSTLSILVGTLAALPYREATVTALCLCLSFLCVRFYRTYQCYQRELTALPQDEKHRVKAAMSKHHHDQFLWRWPLLFLFYAGSAFAIVTFLHILAR